VSRWKKSNSIGRAAVLHAPDRQVDDLDIGQQRGAEHAVRKTSSTEGLRFELCLPAVANCTWLTTSPTFLCSLVQSARQGSDIHRLHEVVIEARFACEIHVGLLAVSAHGKQKWAIVDGT
jgi:hypothetical protein